MTNETSNDLSTNADTPRLPPPAKKAPRRTVIAAMVGAVVLCGAGAAVLARGSDAPLLTPVEPTSIASLQSSGAIGAKGTVAEIYGKSFIPQDGTGRALVDMGPGGEGSTLVAKGETVQVQGRFDDDVLHAAMLIHADGKRIVLAPSGPRGPHGLDGIKDRIGLGPHPDIAGLTALVQSAGYTDVRIAGRGPHHFDMVGRDASGKDKDLHVDFDGRIRDADTL